jgi:regulator of protease activity HflC (stomatin/prohibitin superfamily)
VPAIFIGVALFAVILFILAGVRIINEYENGIIFRLGNFAGIRRAGLNLIIPIVDRMVIVDLRTVARDVPPQDVITRDNVSVKVSAVIYFRVIQADRAIIQVENFLYATSQLAQTTLRSILGQSELDELLAKREEINKKLQDVLDRHTEPWGIKVSNVEVKHVDLPPEMQRAMARQAEAERERRGKVIAADGEFQAATKLSEATEILMKNPAALQLRYLQTLVEISAEKNSTIIFPIPLDLIKPFMQMAEKKG